MNITAYGRVEIDPLTMPRSQVRIAGARGDFAVAADRGDAFRAPPDRPPPTPAEPTGPPAAAAPIRHRSDARGGESSTPQADPEPPPRDLRAAPPAAVGRAGSPLPNAGPDALPGAPMAPTAAGTAAPSPAVAGAGAMPAGTPAATTTVLPGFAPRPAAAVSPTFAGAGTGPSSAAISGQRALAPPANARRLAPALDPRLVAQAEAARESILKTVAFETRADGGRIRMSLEPRDLGRLEIDIAVEEGRRARVVVVADRPEVAAMLERSLPELARTLSAQGLVIDQAEVRQRQPGEARQTGWIEAAAPAEDGDPAGGVTPPAPLRPRVGDGLDTWA